MHYETEQTNTASSCVNRGLNGPYDLNRFAEYVTCTPPQNFTNEAATFEYYNPAAKMTILVLFKSQSSQRSSDGEQKEPTPHDQRGALFSNFSYGHG